MVKSGDHFEEFGPHSRYKHLILEAYFKAWLMKLGLRQGAGPTLCYVDACAGRGTDEQGNAGSPVIAASAAAEASRQMKELRGTAPSISVIAIEKDESHFGTLVENLKPYAPAAEALLGELRDHLPALETRFGTTPTLYFIDPFGLAPLQADVVRRALAGSKNEVLLLFADIPALRHFGAATAVESKVARAHRERRETPQVPLFPQMEIDEAAAVAPKVARSQRALEDTKERATEILDATFGGPAWRGEVEGVADVERRARFRTLYLEFLKTCHASYVLDIPVYKENGEHAYTLIHASKSAYGYRTMKEAVAWALRNAPLPPEVIDGMRSEMSVPLGPVVGLLGERLAGRTERWAEDRTNKGRFSLKHYVLVETPIPCFQLRDLKKLLWPFRRPGRSEIYAFPPRHTSP